MRLKLGLVFFALIALTAAPAFVDGPITVNAKGSKEVKAAKAKGAGKDENIKSQALTNDPAKAVKAPGHKAEAGAEKGVVCGIHVDNRTSLKVQIYIDGNYEGLVGPWGDLYTLTLCGRTLAYARADFVDGSYSSWGPTVFDAIDGTYTWTLRD